MVNGIKLAAGITLTGVMAIYLIFSLMPIYPLFYSLMDITRLIFYFGLLVAGILLLVDGAREERV